MAADPQQGLRAAIYERIFVAFQAALDLLGRSDIKLQDLTDPDNLWGLAVLFGTRAFWKDVPDAQYRVATQALGILASASGLASLWTVLTAVGNADTDTEFDAAAAQLQQGLQRVGVGLLTSFLSRSRLQAFRQTAARILPRPEVLPSRQTLFALERPSLPRGAMARSGDSASLPAGPAPTHVRRLSVGKVLTYGIPVAGGLLLLYGSYRHLAARKRT